MQINWAAFAVAVVVQMVIGYLWFHPAVMGKMWAKANNATVEEMKPKNPGMVYGLTILFTILITFFFVTNVTGPGQEVAPDGHSYKTFQHGLAHAVILTIMVVIPLVCTPALFIGKSLSWMIVQVGYWFLRLAAALGILSAWR